jgi:hypothetical protein
VVAREWGRENRATANGYDEYEAFNILWVLGFELKDTLGKQV